MDKLNHFNQSGDAHMVDVGDKAITLRRAVATGSISMQTRTFDMITAGQHKKGDVLAVARIAGIMAAKKTAELVPLCHPLALTHIDIEFIANEKNSQIETRATVETRGQTGVEMEALGAVQVTLLTIYDMCKAVDRGMRMTDIHLLSKHGGKSGDWTNAPT